MSETPSISSRGFLIAAVTFEAGLAGLAWLLGLFLERPPLAQIDWTIVGAVQGLAAAGPLFVGLVLATRYPIGPLARLDDVMRNVVIPLFRTCRLWELFVISALAGLGEEMLFRGVAQQGILERVGSPWLAVIAAAIVFGLAHPMTLTYAVLAALIGVYLGWLQIATDNLLVPIVAHGAYDFVALVYLVRRQPSEPRHQGQPAASEEVPSQEMS